MYVGAVIVDGGRKEVVSLLFDREEKCLKPTGFAPLKETHTSQISSLTRKETSLSSLVPSRTE